ncbi:Disease resistance protein [Macleaya cordata]|uniref:Disease resistance protein n=1 Tax=Macleaya cordata TaxID=56857 RepID=A0A200Q096_MACCD|nr:Disease resistance protein [Macleaya cordata]
MAEALLLSVVLSGWGTCILQFSLVKLATLIQSEWIKTGNEKTAEEIQHNMVKLQLLLRKIKAILSGAVININANDPGLFWLNNVQEAAYKGVDMVEGFYVESIRGTYGDYDYDKNKYFKEMLSKISSFIEKANELIKEYGGFPLDEATSREHNAKKELLSKILESRNSSQVFIISIVGAAGVGKTTLAQMLFHEEIKKEDYHRIWVSTHDVFNLKMLIKAFMESATQQKFDVLSSDLAQVAVRKFIKKKKIFLVLDGIWHESHNDWRAFLRLLADASHGSVVLVTTQSSIASVAVGTDYRYELSTLSDEECWSILKQNALVSNNKDDYNDEMLKIGRAIASKKCYGIPLVAKSLGELLFAKKQTSEWQFILDTELANLPENGISSSLRFSYFQLPAHLKLCLPYCALFSREYEFEKESLVELWMAEELVLPKGRMRLEDLAESYFEELVERSFFQVISQNANGDEMSLGTPPKYKLNGFIYEMVQFIAVDDSFRLVLTANGSNKVQNPECVRHISVASFGITLGRAFFEQFTNLRTLLCEKENFITHFYPSLLVGKGRLIRVLDLSNSQLQEVPESISNLKLLRYLNVSGTPIFAINKSICKLCVLQTLKVRRCPKLSWLPHRLGALVNLRHFDIDEDSAFPTPPNIGQLTQVQELRKFNVAKTKGCHITELERMDQLRGSLCISFLEKVKYSSSVTHSYLDKKEHLRRLKLQWSGPSHQQLPYESKWIIELLRPHPNLKELVIEGYRFQTWLGNWNWTSALEIVELIRCVNLDTIDLVRELPCLKKLTLIGNAVVTTFDPPLFFGHDEKKGFPSLEILKFDLWTGWKEWTVLAEGDMPLLREIHISNCPSLTIIPDVSCFGSLKELALRSCPSLKKCTSVSRPPQLSHLHIDGCPHLGEDCTSEEATYWPFNKPEETGPTNN